MQILTDSNREKQKISSETAVEIAILRSKKERRYYRGTRKEFTDTISATKKSGKMQKIINKNYNKEF